VMENLGGFPSIDWRSLMYDGFCSSRTLLWMQAQKSSQQELVKDSSCCCDLQHLGTPFSVCSVRRHSNQMA